MVVVGRSELRDVEQSLDSTGRCRRLHLLRGEVFVLP